MARQKTLKVPARETLRRHLPNITVETLPNGYALKFDGAKQPDGYFYFSPEKLLEGFMLHVGLHMTEELDIETMQDFIIATTNFNENSKCLDEIEKLKSKIRQLNVNRLSLANKIIIERNRIVTLVDSIKKLAHKYKKQNKVEKDISALTKLYVNLRRLTYSDIGGISSQDILDAEVLRKDEEE